MANRQRLIASITDLFQEAARMQGLVEEAYLPLDLTLPQLKTLTVLDTRGPQRPNTIAQTIGVTATGVTGILDRLERQEYVERQPDPTDRRATLIHMLAKGDALIEQLASSGVPLLTEVLVEMDDDDLEALNQGMGALMASLRSRVEAEAAAATSR